MTGDTGHHLTNRRTNLGHESKYKRSSLTYYQKNSKESAGKWYYWWTTFLNNRWWVSHVILQSKHQMVRSTKILPSATTSIQIWQVCRIFLSTSLRYLLALYFPRLAWSFQRSRLLSCWEQERSQGIVKRETWNAARAQRSKASQNLREFNALQTITIAGEKLAQMRHC